MAHPNRFIAPNLPLDVFQDVNLENPLLMTPHAPVPTTVPASSAAHHDPRNRNPLQPVNNNMVLNPPSQSKRPKISPRKPASAHAPAPLAPSSGNKLHHVPIAPPPMASGSTDSPKKKPFMRKFKTMVPPTGARFGKENMLPNLQPAGGGALQLNFETHVPAPAKAKGKRLLMEAPDIKDNRPTKKSKPAADELVHVELPPHDSFEPIIDNGSKPSHSYATLIGMAILRSPGRRLTLSQIYKWISGNYSHFGPNDPGWQNSIRHNLSLNKAFYKIERAKDDPGKGNYWSIKPGLEHNFLPKDKTQKKNPAENPASSEPIMRTRHAPARQEKPTIQAPVPPSRQLENTPAEPTLPPTQPVSRVDQGHAQLPPLPTSQATIPLTDLSSDATILISDAAAPEETDKLADTEAPLESNYSPLPPTMHSSPPIPRHFDGLDRMGGATPPPLGRNPASSATRSHRRGFSSLDDSGYISSLDSSVMKHKPNPLTSEADRPKIKRGRAEEEIARLRASSYDSPSKGRSWSTYVPPSSSPFRHDNAQMPPPLTPAARFKVQVKPPPSVSPRTNLRLHRAQVSRFLMSPMRRITAASEDTVPYSPEFQLGEDAFYGLTNDPLPNDNLNLFQSPGHDIFDMFTNFDNSSPSKPSARRPRKDRSQSTSALDMPGSSIGNSRVFGEIPAVTIWEDVPGQDMGTPCRGFDALDTPSKQLLNSPAPPLDLEALGSSAGGINLLPQEGISWTDMGFTATDFMQENVDCAGVDISQGFAKIGSEQAHIPTPPPRNNNRTGSKSALSNFYQPF